jgi:hypothetical protein
MPFATATARFASSAMMTVRVLSSLSELGGAGTAVTLGNVLDYAHERDAAAPNA